MPADNNIYDRDATTWWSDDGHLSLLRILIPVRLEYLSEVFAEMHGQSLTGASILDVGCGGGLFAEALAREGCRVAGADPSEESVAVAREHASAEGMGNNYVVARGEDLPFGEASFDVVVCCDVLEHVDDPQRVIDECARVLRAGGLFLYDTINRNWLSRLFLIRIFQEWRWSRLVPPGLHDGDAFIRPTELLELLAHAGLEPGGMVGIAPDMGPAASVRRLLAIHRLKRGGGSYAEVADVMMMRRCRSLALNYMGHAIRPEVR